MALLHNYHLFNFHRGYRDQIVFIIVNKSQRPEDDLEISSLLTQNSNLPETKRKIYQNGKGVWAESCEKGKVH